jgi:hypothetical protein
MKWYQILDIMTRYEKAGKDGEYYVPEENYEQFIEAVAAADGYDYEKIVDDLETYYKYGEEQVPEVPQKCLDIAAKLCKKEAK